MSRPLRVAFYDYCGKGRAFAQALTARGHVLVDAFDADASRDADVALLDGDYHGLCDRFERIVLYPHGANVLAMWDGRPPHPNVRMMLTHAYGHTQVLASYGLGVPVVPVGWSYTPLAPPRTPGTIRRVLFGPSHPLGTGWQHDDLANLNLAILTDLLTLDIEITVRYWTPNGIPPPPLRQLARDRVTWQQGGTLDHGSVDRADLVIADGTLLAIAVARGVPAVAFGQHVTPDLLPDQPAFRHWPGWLDLVRYPVDVETGGGLREAVADPTVRSGEVADWRARFVGGPFDADLVARLVETVAAG